MSRMERTERSGTASEARRRRGAVLRTLAQRSNNNNARGAKKYLARTAARHARLDPHPVKSGHSYR